MGALNEMIDQVDFILSNNPLVGALLESNPFFSKLVVSENFVYSCENPRTTICM